MSTPEKKTFSITLGALSPDPSDQAAQQGLTLMNARFHDADAHALARLAVRCILTESEAMRARSRLINAIAKDIR